MKYLGQFCVILSFSFLGEALGRVIPLPIPASIYGLTLLFGALWAGLIKVEWVREAGGFLVTLLPLLFVAPVVGIIEHWALIAPQLAPIGLLIVASTLFTFGVSGRVTQRLLRGKGGGES